MTVIFNRASAEFRLPCHLQSKQARFICLQNHQL